MSGSTKLAQLTNIYLEELAKAGETADFDETYERLFINAGRNGRTIGITASQVVERYMTERSIRSEAVRSVGQLQLADG